MISTDWINHLHKGAHTHFTPIGPMHSRHCRGWRTVTRPWDPQIKERPPVAVCGPQEHKPLWASASTTSLAN